MVKIVSGGQTGVDRGGLARGVSCGGWCPPGRTAEDGVIHDRYPLVELPRGDYRDRTLRNVLDSDGTAVVYCNGLEGGTDSPSWRSRPCGWPAWLLGCLCAWLAAGPTSRRVPPSSAARAGTSGGVVLTGAGLAG